MLTVGRRPGEYIVINDNIIVTVDLQDGMMRVSVDAPKEMNIVRGEVYERDRPRPACLDAALRKGKKAAKRAEKEEREAQAALQG